MPCSTGVHSLPNPRAGWTVGDPNTLMVALAEGNSADDWTCCPTVVVKGCGPNVEVKGTAEDAACSWENAGETHNESTRMAARVNFTFVLSSDCSTCALALSRPGYLTALCRTRQRRTRRRTVVMQRRL